MLSHLFIRDIVLIERLDIEFSSGLSILTGETGAGKSIILDALSLVLGGRGDSALVRKGSDEACVTAVFDLPSNHHVYTLLAENSFDTSGTVILKRLQMADGRTRAFINDQPVSLAFMRSIGFSLVEIHGQNDDRIFIDSSSYRDLLDVFGDHMEEVKACRSSWKNWKAAEEALKSFRVDLEKTHREAHYLSSVLDDLEKLNPKPGEEAQLAEMRIVLMKREKIYSDIQELYKNLNGEHDPFLSISSSLRRLQRKTEPVPVFFEEIIKSLDQALMMVDSARVDLEACIQEIASDPQKLEETEERLFSLRAASRKYGIPADELDEFCNKTIEEIKTLDEKQDYLAQLEEKARQAHALYDKTAQNLSSLRKTAAEALRCSVMKEFPSLKFESADFLIHILSDPKNCTETGIDQVDFHLSTHANTGYGSVMKIASGGELSRFFLALKIALADKISCATLIFDEIDTGVSGSIADAIGKRLLHLSQGVQVLAVTHAPQVAACADTHFLIKKSSSDSVQTHVKRIDIVERKEEIARMLSGESITHEARAAASKLLDDKAGNRFH